MKPDEILIQDVINDDDDQDQDLDNRATFVQNKVALLQDSPESNYQISADKSRTMSNKNVPRVSSFKQNVSVSSGF